jgi:hypothetical protein
MFFTLLASPIGWLIILGIIILIFLIIREILCWYWKINEGLDSLNDIKREIATTNTLLRTLEHGPAQPQPAEPQAEHKEQAP